MCFSLVTAETPKALSSLLHQMSLIGGLYIERRNDAEGCLPISSATGQSFLPESAKFASRSCKRLWESGTASENPKLRKPRML
jgi:hypothetical protein